MSKIEVNTVEPQCGTTLTLGACGDTVALGSGAAQTGFGRTGTVDWQTDSIKTAGFTAATGEGYFCNTNGGIFTVALPAGAAGSIVSISDYTRTFNTNNLTVAPDGSEKIGGIAGDSILDVNGQSATFVYVDSTEGWINVQETETSQTGTPPFIIATDGTPCSGAIVCTDYRVHTFTGPGTFCVSNAGTPGGSNTVDYMVVAGGAGGGNGKAPGYCGGGGGAGGYRESPGSASGCYTVSPRGAAPAVALPVSISCYAITVGGGGAGSSTPTGAAGTPGSDASFSTITSTGGGGGGGFGPSSIAGKDGGSGGGGAGQPTPVSGGASTPVTNPVQGTAGGTHAGRNSGAGGGGALVAGGASTPNVGGPGGGGATSSINGTPTARGGGGGGSGNTTLGTGGAGGGGSGSKIPSTTAATVGTVNTGGGGGGGMSIPSCATAGPGAAGGSGVVIIRYKFQ